MRFALAIMATAGLCLTLGTASARDVYTAKKLATFPSDLTPTGLITSNNDAIYGVAYDYSNTSDANPAVTTWVYRVSKQGIITRPCPGQTGGNGDSVVFDNRGTGYTVGAKGILQFSDKAGCKQIASFGPDLDPKTVNGMLTMAPSGVVLGTTRTGKLFFVDFPHGTTKTLQTFKVPANGFLTGVAADHGDLLYGTFVASNASGAVQTTLFTYQLGGQYKPLNVFDQTVYADALTFGPGQMLAANNAGSYLLSPTGKVLSNSVPAQDYALTVTGNHVLYTYQTTTVTPSNPPSPVPVVTVNTYIGQSGLDGSGRAALVDTTAFGSAESRVATGSNGTLYLVMVGASGPHELVQVSDVTSGH
ncbi:MAG TPA: hypothetical protein VKQ29_08865 [Aliidongia sp.]|nr:hypothetical protein [Aliidongia sp.]